MKSKDSYLFLIISGILFSILAPAIFRAGSVLGNFGDLYAFHIPLRHACAASLQSGRMPFWNPFIFSGMPLLADPQAALFYPPSALFHFFPAGYAFTLHAALHLSLAALGMQLLMKRFGLGPGPACALAATFALSPMLFGRIPQGIPTQMASLAWVPWTWLALDRECAPLLGAAWALQFLSGHPQFALVNSLALAAFASRLPRRRLPVMAKGLLIASALACAQAVPTWEFLSRSNRAGPAPGFSAAYSLPPRALSALLLPGLDGTPMDGTYPAPPSEFFEFRCSTIGWAAALLAAAGLGSPPLGALPWALAGAGAFLSLGSNNPLLPPLDRIPILGQLRVPARFMLLSFWGLLLCAAAGAMRLGAWRKLPRWAFAAAFALVIADLGPRAAKWTSVESPGPFLGRSESFAREMGGRLDRFVSHPDLANPNKAMLYRAMNVNGYAAFFLGNYDRFVRSSSDPRSLDASRVLLPESARKALLPLAVSRMLSPAGRLVPLPGAPRLGRRIDGGEAAASSGSPERWHFHGPPPPTDTRLIFAMPHFPGWKAWVGGRPADIRVEDGLFQGVPLAAKMSWEADFRFSPSGWPWLVLASTASLALWLASCRRVFA